MVLARLKTVNWILAGLAVLSLAGSYWLLRLSDRVPLCPACRLPSEPWFPGRGETARTALEVVYWCHRCGQVVSRRNIDHTVG
jgi:hypothetical protein